LVGISLVEDLAVVAIVVLLPALSTGGGGQLRQLEVGLAKAVVLLAPVYWLARRAVPGLLARVARAGNAELFLLVTISIAVGTAAVTARAGLFLALGAFLGGLLVSESEYAHDALARILPMRDLFVPMFFVSIGMLAEPRLLVSHGREVVVLVLLVILGLPAIWFGITRVAGYGARTAGLTGLGLGQIGEFSDVLAAEALGERLIAASVYQVILATSLVSIVINARLFR
jgi:CPA2 family monovalent cation:H+ antiporter-2